MPTISKNVRITMDDAAWHALHNLTIMLREKAKTLGLEGLREEAVISAILKQSILDNHEELHARFSERTIRRAQQKGLLGPVCAETAKSTFALEPAGTNDW